MPGLRWRSKGAKWRIWVHCADAAVADEFDVAEAWLFATLAGSAILTAAIATRLYEGVAPESATVPFGLVTFLTAQDDEQTYGDETAVLDYLVVFVNQAESYAALTPLAAAAKAVLTNGEGSDSNGTVVKCVRIKPHRLEQIEE